VQQLAASGDPAGLLAAAILLGAVATPGASKAEIEPAASTAPATTGIGT
jgi:hypothetical protein